MNTVGLILVVLFSINIVANANEAARGFLNQQLSAQASEYGISKFEVGTYLGANNNKHAFKVKYESNTCKSIVCSKVQCLTQVSVPSDSLMDFVAQQDPNFCK